MNNYIYPVSSIGITMSEIPGEVAIYIEFSGCTQNCVGCHSPHLQGEQGDRLSLEDLVYNVYAISEKYKDATAILLMGGTTHIRMTKQKLLTLIKALHKKTYLPIGLYSGKEEDLDEWLEVKDIQWLKTGAYVMVKGGLDEESTNQRLYEKELVMVDTDNDGIYTRSQHEWKDITHKFQPKEEESAKQIIQ